MQSRTGSYFESLEHLNTELLGLFQSLPNLSGVVLDGELYTENMPFEELVGIVKKKTLSPEDVEKVKQIHYHVYDIVDTSSTEPYISRYNRLQSINSAINSQYIQLVKTVPVAALEEFRAFFSQCIEEGYEGAMLRNTDGKYQCNYRSHDLQKYKEFFEGEYQICGFREAAGRDKGTVVWFCKLPDDAGSVFSVRPKGTIDMRRKWFLNGDAYIGKWLTIRYFSKSLSGKPGFNVGVTFRDEGEF
jgi:DNA ligase-1